MRTQRNYYEIMGLERTASTDDIKRKYRELARRYHPDVVQDDGMNQKIFIQITHAYKTLVDPEKRVEYDRVLTSGGDAFSAAVAASGMSQAQVASQPVIDEYYYPTSPEVDALLKQADAAFSGNQMVEAADLCKRALEIERANPKTHALLGDIYSRQNRIGAAMSEYSYAILYNPGDIESRQKLNKLKKMDTGKGKKGRSKRHSAPPPQRPTAPPSTGSAPSGPSNNTASAPKTPPSASRPSSRQETSGSILDKLKTLFKR